MSPISLYRQVLSLALHLVLFMLEFLLMQNNDRLTAFDPGQPG